MPADRDSAAAHAGRYAPSPTGDLHKGSLVAALASFLQARAHGAPWFMRIDDLDAPRVIPGAAARILRTLEVFGLYWDGAVMYQSQRRTAHEQALTRLRRCDCLFACGCSRSEARSGPVGIEGRIYPGTCRNGLPAGKSPRSLRVRVEDAPLIVADRIQGRYEQNLATGIGDFVVRRADGVIAYQLATVVDDISQGVAEVVRGADLLSSTPRQMFLYGLLERDAPTYAHVPLLVDGDGWKLGKSNGALQLDTKQRGRHLVEALTLLGQALAADLAASSIDDIIAWAIRHWRPQAIPAVQTLAVL